MESRPEQDRDDDFSSSQQPPQQSVVVAVLIFLTVGTLVIGAFTSLSNIRAPFDSTESSKMTSATATQEPTEDVLRTVDTDGDTLNDYDELNLYRTSPYLKDTDSDGYDDKQEMETGHDPLCATGKVCAPDGLASAKVVQAPPGVPATSPAQGGAVLPQDIFSQLESYTPSQVRDLLRKQGIPEAQIQALDDATVMDVYKQAVQKLKDKNSTTQAAPSTQFDLSTLSDPKNPRPDEIRTLLKGKIPDDQLQKIDDATLKKLFDDSLQQQRPPQ